MVRKRLGVNRRSDSACVQEGTIFRQIGNSGIHGEDDSDRNEDGLATIPCVRKPCRVIVFADRQEKEKIENSGHLP